MSCSGSSNNQEITPPEIQDPIEDLSNCNTKRSSNILFEDNFNEADIDANSWSHETKNTPWFNNEAQFYTAPDGNTGNSTSNAFVEDGLLKIQPILENISLDNGYTFSYSSTRLISRSKKSFGYDTDIIICFKLPQGEGMWPAIWMMPQTDDAWPEGGEIDIMEARGRLPLEISSTVHFGVNSNGIYEHQYLDPGYAYVSSEENFHDNFHSITFKWRENSIRMFLDNRTVPYFETTNDFYRFSTLGYPFSDHEFYILLNVAVGGHFGGTNEWKNIGNVNAQYPRNPELFCNNRQCTNHANPDKKRLLVDWIQVVRSTD